MEQKKKERQLNRNYELEEDPIKKDDKFDKMLTATRETIRKSGIIERATYDATRTK